MTYEYRIPLRYREGCCGLKELPCGEQEALVMFSCEGDVLTYKVPLHGNEVRLYQVVKKELEENTRVTYGEDGVLLYVEMMYGDEVRLLYINLPDDDTARFEVRDFAEQSAENISSELLNSRGKAARLFIEYCKSVEDFDFAAKKGSPEDMRAVLDSLNERALKRGLDKVVIDDSGNYPRENRIECDSYTLTVMLKCASGSIQDELLATVIRVMTEGIKTRTVASLNKTADFKFIVSEYD